MLSTKHKHPHKHIWFGIEKCQTFVLVKKPIHEEIKRINEEEGINEAFKVYQNAVKNGHADEITHNTMIYYAGQRKLFSMAVLVYENAMNTSAASVLTTNYMIQAAGNCKQHDFVLELYQIAINNGNTDELTHRLILIAMITSDKNYLALNIYRNLIEHGMATMMTSFDLIETAVKLRKFKLAIDVYAIAIQNGLADRDAHCLISKIAERQGWMEWSQIARSYFHQYSNYVQLPSYVPHLKLWETCAQPSALNEEVRAQEQYLMKK